MSRRKMPWGWMDGWMDGHTAKESNSMEILNPLAWVNCSPVQQLSNCKVFTLSWHPHCVTLKKTLKIILPRQTLNLISSATTTRWTDFSESSSTAASGVFFGYLGGECRTLIREKSIPSLRPLMPFPKLLQQTLLPQPPLLLLWMQMCAEWEGRLLLRFREEDWESTIWVMCKWASEQHSRAISSFREKLGWEVLYKMWISENRKQQ